MADLYRERDEGIPAGMHTMYQEAGHGCHGEVVAAHDTWRVDALYNSATEQGDKTWIVPDNEEWRILWIQVWRANTPTAGNRTMCAAVYDVPGNFVGVLATAGATQAANEVRHYTFAPGLDRTTAFFDTSYMTAPIPDPTILYQQQRLRVWDKANIDLLDDMVVAIQIMRRTVRN